MNYWNKVTTKIKDWSTAKQLTNTWKAKKQKVVFTNGCFDLIHYGHLHYLAEARELGDKLLVGLNSDTSVQQLKGVQRPIKDQLSRAYLLASLEVVDGVIIFEEDTPLQLIRLLEPDILVKGGDWLPSQIVGADLVLAKGGQVKSLPFQSGHSTTNFIDKIKAQQ